MAPTIAELSSSSASEASTPPTGNDSPFDNMAPQSVEPIAIIGMGMRLPGGVHDAESFWKMLVEKRDGRCKVPADRYNVDAFYGPGKPGHVNTKYGYFLQDLDLAHLDAGFWSIAKQEAELVDPQQRLLLEVVYECLENAGANTYRGEKVGCYVGVFGEDWADLQGKDSQISGLYRIPGYGDFAVSNRVSYEFDFQGPSMTIRTACSSSLIALHEACQGLYSGECSAAIVAGTNLILSPHMTIAMTEQGVLSPTGSCKSFSDDADGYARGEGISTIYVKKLSDALRDGDPVRAVIRSTCVNSDGKTAGISYPNTEMHAELMRRSHALAGITDFSKTAMIECHGTGTPVGDPLETKAVAKVFGQHGIFIGSVKPNVGHTEGASGVTSVIKMVLALEHRIIPPNINFRAPNPKIPFDEAKLKIPLEATAWPADRAERVGVNSFGIGGANAHTLLESAASFGIFPSSTARAIDPKPQILLLSANHADSLRLQVQNHLAYIAQNPGSIRDLSYTLGVKRYFLPHRAFCITSGQAQPKVSSFAKITGLPKVVGVFTGQGAQYARMGFSLILGEPSFRETIRRLDAVLAKLPDGPSWTMEDALLKPENTSQIMKAEFSQPCCTAIQIALFELLSKCGIRLAAVVGHSSGEIAAAFACGAITASDAIRVAYYRGKMTGFLATSRPGAMAAIGLGMPEVLPLLRPGVVVGCENSPESVTLTGDAEQVKTVVEAIKAEHPQVLARLLRVNVAYHSDHMQAVAVRYAASLGAIKSTAPVIPFYSSVTGEIVTEAGRLGASYWVENSVSPVLFKTAVQGVLHTIEPRKLFLEFGPHSALGGPIRQIVRFNTKSAEYVSSLIRDKDAQTAILECVGQLYQNNVPLDYAQLLAQKDSKVLTNLPTYPWHHEGRYWAESRTTKDWRLRNHSHHDILGARINDTSDLDPIWRNMLRIKDIPWIEDHDIAGDIVFPGAGYVALAGEAIRQLTGSHDYTIRRLDFKQALLLQRGTTTELITHFRSSRLTNSLVSEWFDFTVTSLNGSHWIEHCAGQARAGPESTSHAIDIKPLPRAVPSHSWYNLLRKFGFRYGPRFQGLRSITAGIEESTAVAKLDDVTLPNESSYTMHPATIDAAFHLLTAASSQGLMRLFNKLSVPSYIGELYVRKPTSQMTIRVQTNSALRGPMDGNAIGVSDGEVVFHLKDLQFADLARGDDMTGSDPHAAAELWWRPDINFLDASQVSNLMSPSKHSHDNHPVLERLALACIVELSATLVGKRSENNRFNNFLDWLQLQAQKAAMGTYPEVPDCKTIVDQSSAERLQMIQTTYQNIHHGDDAYAANAIHRIFQSFGALLKGEVDALTILLEDDLMRMISRSSRPWDCDQLFQLIAHSKPNLRVLEIGAGVGSTTSTILPSLYSETGERMYFSYTYTDTSSSFLDIAKERFKKHEALEYTVLDISRDPSEQGFQPGSFDLIIASDVIHATPELQTTLRNVHQLLTPQGRFFLQELRPLTNWINFVMGALPDWWQSEAHSSLEKTYMSPAQLEIELRQADFELDAMKPDNEINSTCIARPTTKPLSAERYTLLRGDKENATLCSFENALRATGLDFDVCTLDMTPHPRQTIISIIDLDLEGPFFAHMDSMRFLAFQGFLSRVKEGTSILWVTGAAQVKCKDPRYAMALGMARTIRAEANIDMATLELEHFDQQAWSATCKVLEYFQRRLREPDSDPVLEYVHSDGYIQSGKFHWINVTNELKEPTHLSKPQRLNIGQRGALQTLRWEQYTFPTLPDDHVEVEVMAVGMNFKDVLIAIGIVDTGANQLGHECAGIIRRVGANVAHLNVGDRVIALEHASYATTLYTSEKLCAKIPDSLSFVHAATMPVVYGTVVHGIIDIAQMEKHQTVLIHSACGGVGIAAIQICQMLDVEIFCTVGSPAKIEYLVDTFGIARDHIFNSRDTSFLHNIKAATKNRGVDVVLNSLSGELLHASWECVAEFGTHLEIGKRDMIGHASLSLNLFEQNRRFVGIDYSQIMEQRPAMVTKIQAKFLDYYRQGYIQPIRPIETFEASHIEEAFRHMQKGAHLGKIVITDMDSLTGLEPQTEQKLAKFKAEAAYVLIGGLGGLGQAVATWMVQHGARHLVFLSRSAGRSAEHQAFQKELEARGCVVNLIKGDVSNAGDVAAMVKSTGKPICGVIQASMVLRDAALHNMSFEDWQTAVNPKVQGTWNIHQTLSEIGAPLDFFVLFSSISGLVGLKGQANYSAANTFLDAFVQYRHSQGLPASVIDIGVMEDIGYVSEHSYVLDALKSTHLHMLHEQDLLDGLQLAIERSLPTSQSPATPSIAQTHINPSQIVIGLRSSLPLSAPSNRTIWKRDPRMSLYRNMERHDASNAASTTNNHLKDFLRDIATDPARLLAPATVPFLATEIGRTLFSFMLRDEADLDLDIPPKDLGLDSLVGIELRNWFKQQLGYEVTVLDILAAGSMTQLAETVVKGLVGKYMPSVETADDDARARQELETKAP